MGLGKTYSADYLIDSNGNGGISGQVLISTATGIDWSDGSSIIGGPFLPLAGGTMTGNIDFNDDVFARFGNGNDLEIGHDASNSYVTHSGVGNLIIRNTEDDSDIVFQSDNGAGGVATYLTLNGTVGSLDAAVELRFPDGIKAKFGSSQDLLIYHDGSNSYIQDTSGTGDLRIDTSAFRLRSANGGESMITAFEDNSVNLMFNAFTKLSTSNTGITVTGKISGLIAGTANTDAVNVQQLNDATTGALIFKGTWSAAPTTTSVLNGIVSNSATIVIAAANAGISVGATVTGAALPAGITVTAIAADEITLTISSAQSMTSGATLTFTTVGGIPDLSQTARKVTGDYYICETAGVSTPNGTGTTPNEWAVGDWVAFSDLATDAWQKIDNSSVLSGAGTGGSLAAWSGSGTSVTLQNAPATFSGNDTTFAGNVALTGNLDVNLGEVQMTDGYSIQWGGQAMLNHSGTSTTIGDSSSSSVLTLTSGNATFAGNVTLNNILLTPAVLPAVNTPSINLRSSNNEVYFQSGSANVFNFINAARATMLSLDGTSNATFAGNVIAGTGTFQVSSGDSLILRKGTGTPAISFQGTASDPQTVALVEGISGGGLKIYTANGTVSAPGYSAKITLALNGDTTFARTVTATNRLTVASTATGNPYLDFVQGGVEKAFLQYIDSGDELAIQSDGRITFRTTAAASEQMRINSSGNIGIGTTSDDFKLYINGTLGVSDLPGNGSSTSVLVQNQITTSLAVVNGDFAADSNWSKGTGWTISGGKANVDGTQTAITYMSQSGILPDPPENIEYIITYTISNYSAGAFAINVGGYLNSSPSSTANGTYEVKVTPTNALSNTLVYIEADADAVGSIDNISVKQVTAGTDQIQVRELSSDAFGPGNGPYLPLAGGTLTGDITLDDGSGATPSIYFKNEADNFWRYLMESGGDFSIKEGTSTRLTFQAGGNVGISVTSPSVNLAVNKSVMVGAGSVGSSTINSENMLIVKGKNNYSDGTTWYGDYGQILLSATTNATGSARQFLITNALDNNKFAIVRSTDTNTVPVVNSTGNAVNSGTADFVINNAGNIGMGTTTPGTKLDIVGKFRVSDDVTINNSSPELYMLTGATHFNWMLAAQENVNNAFEITPSTVADGTTFSTPALVVLQSGNVGIGTNTPTTNLEIFDTDTSVLTMSHDGGGGSGSRIDFNLINAGVSQPITAQIKATDDGSFRSNIIFTTKTAASGSSALSERMRITAAGDVGIGTTDPSEGDYGTVVPKLHVVGQNAAGTSSLVARFQAGDDANDSLASILINHSNDRGLLIEGGRGGAGTIADDDAVSHLGLVNSAGSRTRMITLRQSNAAAANSYNVGIGTTTPNEKLQVVGNIQGGGIDQLSNKFNTNAIFRGQNDGAAYVNLIAKYDANAGLLLGNQQANGVIDNYVAGLLYNNSTNNLNIFVNNGNAIVINASREVGIGTTDPGNKLVVRGPSSDANNGDGNVAQFEGPSGTNGFQVYVNDTLNNTGIQTKNGDSFIINPGGGRVGIGTTGPTQILHVVGNARVTGAFYDSTNSPGTAGQVLSSTATGTDWVAASNTGNTNPTDMFEINNAAISAQDQGADINSTLILTAGNVTRTAATAMTVQTNGQYAVNFTFYLRTDNNSRQTIGAYLERSRIVNGAAQLIAIPGSLSATYTRVDGISQGDQASVTNSFFCDLQEDDILTLQLGRTDLDVAPVNIGIVSPAWPNGGTDPFVSLVKHHIAFRRVAASS